MSQLHCVIPFKITMLQIVLCCSISELLPLCPMSAMEVTLYVSVLTDTGDLNTFTIQCMLNLLGARLITERKFQHVDLQYICSQVFKILTYRVCLPTTWLSQYSWGCGDVKLYLQGTCTSL